MNTSQADLWLEDVEITPSPNADERPAGTEVDLLVIHNISLPPGDFGGHWIDDLFLNRLDPDAHPYFQAVADMKVSAHLLVRRDGRCTQFVALNRRAWHAGESCFGGRTRCNDFSVGMELEGTDTSPYTDAQYSAIARLTAQLRRHYPAITPERITGHCDIAPHRKTDPGPAFDWERYRASLR